MLSGIRYSALGPLSAWRATEKIELGWAKQQAVLGVMLLEMNKPVPVRKIVDGVWGDQGPRDARNAVQTYISRLRRVLSGPGESLVHTEAGYLLHGEPTNLDVVVFEQHLDAAHERYRDSDVAGTAEQVDAALALWRGEPFSGLDGPLLEAERQRLAERHLSAQELRARIGIELGRAGESVAGLTRLVAENPLQERLRALLMLALYRSGRRAAALDVFQETRRLLAEELGVDPGEEIRDLHERMLRGDPDLTAPGGQPATRNTLPRDVVDFTGREGELARLLTDPPPSTAAVVEAVDGSAGVGKTALAVHAAHRLAHRYPDAQLFVNLHGHSAGRAPVEPLAALDTLLRALGVPGERIPARLDARAGLWRAELADRAALVVLDDATDAEQVRALLPGTARSLTLVTSRRRLVDLEAAHALSLDVLPHDDAVALFARIVGDHRPADEADTVAEVVGLCGRLPLAIRIAAARLRTRPAWTVRYLADRLRQDRPLAELEAGDRGVTAAFSLSYRHLTGEQQRVFRLLGLHTGPDVDADAVAALVGLEVGAAGRVLEDLVDVHVLEQPTAGRYRFHDLVRHFARDVVERTDPEPVRCAALDRLGDYYLHTAAAAVNTIAPHERPRRPDLPAPAVLSGYDEALAWLDAERANLLAVAGRPRYTTLLADVLHRYLHLRNHIDDALVLDSLALAVAPDRDASGRALHRLGLAHYRSGNQAEARSCQARAMEVFRASGDRQWEADVLRATGVLDGLAGRHRDAIDINLRALEIIREVGGVACETAALSNIGVAYQRLGRYDDALEHLTEAAYLARSIGHDVAEGYALCETGVVHRRRGEYAEALDHHRRALAKARANGHRVGEGYALARLGEVLGLMGDEARALDHLDRALAASRAACHRVSEGDMRCVLGDLHLRAGRRAEASAEFDRALAIAVDTGDRGQEARAHEGLGDAAEDPEVARRHWLRALEAHAVMDAPGADVVRDKLAR
ncbi:AfsR/SARP family transcriptional regulator [Saccharothrix luteola]|uniref:AfsR/SARP family transcriptional regulator n=1 Tax=Saccharothrix luteola TaxID=2893018 RepID=UPI001E3F9718|nr:BTAD domain-containing putative transcriptional regulator [Saccharothrix luteola]MCC8243209.1 tetratricopeptide repeat protein [Saccharothrix luteola]